MNKPTTLIDFIPDPLERGATLCKIAVEKFRAAAAQVPERHVMLVPGAANGFPAIAIHVDGEPRGLIIGEDATATPRAFAATIAALAARTFAGAYGRGYRFEVAFSKTRRRANADPIPASPSTGNARGNSRDASGAGQSADGSRARAIRV